MIQSSPNLSMILLGGSGMLGAVTLVTRGIIDKKEAQISDLTQRNKRLETEIQEEKEKRVRMVADFAKRLTNLDAGRLSPEDAVHLKELFNLIQGFENLQEGFSDCKQAAEWLILRKKAWAKQACEHASRTYRNLVPRDKTNSFEEEIRLYLTWVETCLSKNGHTRNTPLSDFVEVNIISSPHPYAAAISHLLDQGDGGELTSEQIAYLREVLLQLKGKLREIFEH